MKTKEKTKIEDEEEVAFFVGLGLALWKIIKANPVLYGPHRKVIERRTFWLWIKNEKGKRQCKKWIPGKVLAEILEEIRREKK